MNIFEKAHMLHRVWRYRLREEKESIRYLLNQDLNGKTVLDIGANKGIYTYWMSKSVGNDGHVISFEPQPELGDFLRSMSNAFGLGNVRIVNAGLSEEEDELLMVRSKVGSGGAHLINEGEDLSAYGAENQFRVSVKTLDNFYLNNKLQPPAFIKCDVENHELQVFKGAENTLLKYKPTLLFECHHQEAEAGHIFSYLEDLGYYGFFIIDGKKISSKEFAYYPYRRASNTHRNYIFVPKG